MKQNIFSKIKSAINNRNLTTADEGDKTDSDLGLNVLLLLIKYIRPNTKKVLQMHNTQRNHKSFQYFHTDFQASLFSAWRKRK